MSQLFGRLTRLNTLLIKRTTESRLWLALPIFIAVTGSPLFQLWLVPSRAVHAQALPQTVFGLDFSPYINGQNPNSSPAPQISATQIRSRLQIIAPHTKWIRSFSSSNGLEQIPS